MKSSLFRSTLPALFLAILCTDVQAQRGGGSVERLDPEQVEFRDGTGTVPDFETFDKLSYQGPDVLIDTHLTGLKFVKFQIERAGADNAQIYFMNTKTHRAHMMFMQVAGLPRGGRGQMRGVLIYRPHPRAPDGTPGLYTFEFEPNDSFPFEKIQIAHDLLVAHMPILKGRIGYYPLGPAIPRYKREKPSYEDAKFPVYLERDLYADLAYLSLNRGATFGRLRLMKLGQRPSVRDVVVYKSLPNELTRVAGIITDVLQTPLSHVNLRAIQDGVPNAFITGASKKKEIAELLGKYVYYKVTADGYEIREATAAEVDTHFVDLRPTKPQVPKRDLRVTEIRSLRDIKFGDSSSVGVKTANLATLRTLRLLNSPLPEGFGVPFHFYDAFMKHNGLYKRAATMLKDPDFQKDRGKRDADLKKFRRRIKKCAMPKWMMDALSDVQASFPDGTSIRCRSSTNNEDLPGFSGAGLYDSFTHHPREGHLSKSIKQVYASLWNTRAFEERDFLRVDHFAAAMGVLVHPSFKGELANGVAVTDDIFYQTNGNYYLNTQVGEDLVTNPEEQSIPEEILLSRRIKGPYKIMRESNRVADGKQILTAELLQDLRTNLRKIHRGFRKLYGYSMRAEFAMEIEFKVTHDGVLSIKQARPWVYAPRPADRGSKD